MIKLPRKMMANVCGEQEKNSFPCEENMTILQVSRSRSQRFPWGILGMRVNSGRCLELYYTSRLTGQCFTVPINSDSVKVCTVGATEDVLQLSSKSHDLDPTVHTSHFLQAKLKPKQARTEDCCNKGLGRSPASSAVCGF